MWSGRPRLAVKFRWKTEWKRLAIYYANCREVGGGGMKQKKKKLDKGKEARRLARAVAGAPSGTRVIADKRKKAEKHKKKWIEGNGNLG